MEKKAKISVIVFIGNQINFNLLIGFLEKHFISKRKRFIKKRRREFLKWIKLSI